ncbi:MAG: division/cell wall cluster transcriptional repressor MraZ [bacterium]
MFFGEYQHNLDAKGRLSIPSKMRNQCGELVYITRGHEGCLEVYNEEGWDKKYQSYARISQKKKNGRAFMRLVSSSVSDCPFDKMGRVNIPANLRKEAKLMKECTVIGVGDHMEIWDTPTWLAYEQEQLLDFDELSEMLEDGDEA